MPARIATLTMGRIAAVIAMALLAGCGEEPRRLDWGVRLADPSLEPSIIALEGRVLAGGCGGAEIRRVVVARGEAPPELRVAERGLHGLSVRAIDGACRFVAEGCAPVDLPSRSSSLSVELAPIPVVSACPLAACGADRCGAADAAVDAAVDAGAACVAGECPFTPSNVGLVVGWDAGGADVVLDDRHAVWVYDTRDGSIVSADRSVDLVAELGPGGVAFRRVPLPGGAEVGVFAMRSLTLMAGVTLEPNRNAALPLVLLVRERVRIEGTLDVSAEGSIAGPGGGEGGPRGTVGRGAGGGAPGEDVFGDAPDPGAGGGGFGAPGGRGGGGDGAVPATGGAGGDLYGTVELVPLVGGSGGGGAVDTGALGGGGGGAVQISAGVEIEVASGGTIDASGGGATPTGPGEGAAGGGSGGAVLLEAPRVTIAGSVAANGGSGGAGGLCATGATSDCEGMAGVDGAPEPVPAPGPAAAGDGGRGGDGSGRDGIPGDGGAAENGGGGGGGGGRIRIHTAAGTERYDGALSPSPGSGLATVGRVAAP